ncbi:MAG: CPBP family intramembrane metalloprotease [Planctomycetaceae bacterium]|jgi:membrane protease YdiL (CAAX protease family)|nr:CPBP family intramembrane metalloprotease [Planctomycetaceae bacterium]
MDSYAMLSMAVVGLICLSVFIAPPWIYLFITRTRRRRPLLTQWEQQLSQTDFLDVIFVIIVYLTSQALALFVVADLHAISSGRGFNPILITPLNSAAGLSVMAGGLVAFTLVYVRRRDLRCMRFRFDYLKRQVLIGLAATACVLPSILLINGAVSILVTKYSHPVIEAFLSEMSLSGLLSTAFSVVIAAPLVEEFVFRGILLSFLQRIFDRNWAMDTIFFCNNTQVPTGDASQSLTGRYGAIVVTSVLFAGLHVGQGAAYIPLFFLAIALGYMTQKTGSILPAIIVHVSLNSLSTITLAWTYLQSTIV